MHYLYGEDRNGVRRLVARFGSEQQLLTYVNYATLKVNEDGTRRFEQQTALTGCVRYSYRREFSCRRENEANDEERFQDVPFNPSPTML